MTTDQGGNSQTVRLTFEGHPVTAPAGASVAAALVAAGIVTFGSRPMSEAPRGAFCMMGSCFDCMVEIDGVANRQACMETVRDGQAVRRMPARIASGERDDATT